MKFAYQTHNLPINPTPPLIMHVDLNSCFATLEQQANPWLRGRPVAMTNRTARNPTIIAASYEAKRRGVGVGFKVLDAKTIIPELVVLETDPDKYLHAHQIFKRILKSYSPTGHMKSIDEGVIDFRDHIIKPSEVIKIGYIIKQRLATQLGEWVTANVGIGPSRFLAKVAANLHKPDGLDVIDHQNLQSIYSQLDLMALPGINKRFNVRLITHHIANPLDFLAADSHYLAHTVFKSITGYYWYWRLRGYEVDEAISTTKSVGKQYVLPFHTNDDAKLQPIVLKMCALMGERLRSHNWATRGLSVGCWFTEGKGWHIYQKQAQPLFTTAEIYKAVKTALAKRPGELLIQTLSMACMRLEPASQPQASLFLNPSQRPWQLTRAIDQVNTRFGGLTLIPASLIGTDDLVVEKIPFGNRHLGLRR